MIRQSLKRTCRFMGFDTYAFEGLKLQGRPLGTTFSITERGGGELKVGLWVFCFGSEFQCLGL